MKKILAIYILASLMGCSNGEANEPQVGVTPPDTVPVGTQPAIPAGPSATSELTGTTDKHGIRPDVTAYIQKTYGNDPKKFEAAIVLAKSNQQVLELIASGEPATQDRVNKMVLATKCFAQNSDAINFSREYDELNAATFNTEARFKASGSFGYLIDGFSLTAPEVENACEAAK